MQCTKPSVGSLHIRTAKLVKASLAHNSNATYKTAIESFESFRNLYQLQLVWPASRNDIIMFISYCFECSYAPSTIVTYIAGISFKHKLNSWFDPMQLFVVKKMLEGCKRLGKRQDLRAPVTMKILKSICDRLPFVCYNEYEALMFRTVYLIAYYGLLRIGEIVFTSMFQSDRPIQITDISFRGKTVVQITIRVAKNNQKGQPIYLRIPCIPDNTLCPVCCLQNYLTVRQQQPGQLFIHSNGKPLTRSQFTAVWLSQFRVQFIGLDILDHIALELVELLIWHR